MGESMRSIVSDDEMPCMTTVFKWLREKADFAQQYARAKEEGAESFADRITDIGIGTLEGKYDPQAARVAVDSLKWAASKLKPKKYGDRVSHEHTGQDGGPIQTITRKIVDPQESGDGPGGG